MIKPRFRPPAWLAALMVVLLLLNLVAVAILAEGAVHPLLTRRASDTAILAYSIAQATGATEHKVSIRARDGVALNAWWLAPERQNGQAVMVCHGAADSAYGGRGFSGCHR